MRVKRGTTSLKRRRKILKYAKGFRWGRKSKERAAREALLHAWSHSFRGRKEKKRNFRNLWTVRLNAAAREHGLTYSKLISKVKKANITLNRKMLSEIAISNPEIFKEIISKIK